MESVPQKSVSRDRRARLPVEQLTHGVKPFPATTQRAMAMAEDPDVSLVQLGQTVSTDPALASKVLRLANSTIYRRGSAVESVELAVTRIGSRALYEMVASIAVSHTFQAPTPAAKAIREHSVGVASVARFLSRERKVDVHERAFLAGLLHDIGKILCLQAGCIDYDAVPEQFAKPGRHHLFERRALGFDHAKVGWQALRMWQLPEPIPTAVAWHHQATRAYAAGVELASLVTLICAADIIDHQLFQEELDASSARELVKEAPLTRLELTADWLRYNWRGLCDAKAECLSIFEP